MTTTLNDSQLAALKAVDAGTTSQQFVYSTPKSMKFYLDNGLVEANPTVTDDKGQNPFRITEAGKALLAPPADETAPAAPAAAAPAASLFVMQMAAPLPKAKGKGKGNTKPRTPKYPLADLVEGAALFIVSPDAAKARTKTKGFGSMVSTFNQNNPDRYITSRFVEDGKAAGFVGQNPDGTTNPEAFAGVPGTGIYRMPLDQKPERKERKPKVAAETAA